MKSRIRLEVEKALADIKYDKWHDKLHDRIRLKATVVRPSHGEQVVITQCGECNQSFQFRVPPTNKSLTVDKEDANA